MKSNLSALWFSLLGTVALTSSAAEPGAWQIHLRFVSLEQPLIDLGVGLGNGTALPVVIPSDNLSREISYLGNRHLQLVKVAALGPQPTVAPGIVPDGVELPKVPRGARYPRPTHTGPRAQLGPQEVFGVDLPAIDQARYIILVHPSRGAGLTVINDPVGSFPLGSDRYLNLCPYPVLVDVPSGRQLIPANGTKAFRPGALHQKPYHLKLITGNLPDQNTQYTAFVLHQEDIRRLRILQPVDEADLGLTMKVVSERDVTPKDAPPNLR